jgi:hypothetical protein
MRWNLVFIYRPAFKSTVIVSKLIRYLFVYRWKNNPVSMALFLFEFMWDYITLVMIRFRPFANSNSFNFLRLNSSGCSTMSIISLLLIFYIDDYDTEFWRNGTSIFIYLFTYFLFIYLFTYFLFIYLFTYFLFIPLFNYFLIFYLFLYLLIYLFFIYLFIYLFTYFYLFIY